MTIYGSIYAEVWLEGGRRPWQNTVMPANLLLLTQAWFPPSVSCREQPEIAVLSGE